jgi:hypothetical protein
MAWLFSIKESQEKLSTVCPGGLVSLDDRLHQINQSLRFFYERGSMMLPVEEVCGSKGLINKYLSSSLDLTFLIIIYGALGFPQGHLQGSWSLRRGRVLTVISQMLLIKWEMWVSTGGLGVCIESIGFKVARGVEAPEASEPDFICATVPPASPSWARGRGSELGTGGRGGLRGT